MSFSGDYTQAAGTLDLRGGALAVSASVNINGGVLSGAGTINGNVFNRAQVSPGAIQINGDYNQTLAGALKIAIAGTSPGQFGALQIQGQASLAGSLNLALTNSPEAQTCAFDFFVCARCSPPQAVF